VRSVYSSEFTNHNFSSKQSIMNTFSIFRNSTVILLLVLAGWRVCVPDFQVEKTATTSHQQVRNMATHSSNYSLRRIEDIRAGDIVYARDPQTGETTSRKVLRTFKRTSRHLQLLGIENPDGTVSQIETTGEHPFFVKDRGQVNAADLEIGDRVETLTGQFVIVTSNVRESHPEGVTVYNFEVQHDHTYFVLSHAANGPPLWAHNSDGCLGNGSDAELPEQIFRGGGRSPSNLTPRPQDDGALSFRSSLTNPVPPPPNGPVFPVGGEYIAIDPKRLPPGSVDLDDSPPGHVSVIGVDVATLRDAITGKGKFPK
jgi:hypothetical protein